MNTQTAGGNPLNIVALGWAISAALIVLFVICLVVSFVFPDLPASQGWSAWIALFSVTPTEHPLLSVRVWIDGIAFSLVFGWVTAVALGLIYNRLIGQ
jgi:heme/copper-type cytochrome/quinol oxidase subunit 1